MYVNSVSSSMATTLRDHLSGKNNSWLKQQEKSLRA